MAVLMQVPTNGLLNVIAAPHLSASSTYMAVSTHHKGEAQRSVPAGLPPSARRNHISFPLQCMLHVHVWVSDVSVGLQRSLEGTGPAACPTSAAR